MNLEIIKEESQERSLIRLKGEVDAFTAPRLKDELLPLVEQNRHEVIVDLADVVYMDSTGLGVFIGALKAAKSSNSQLKIRNTTERIQRLFTITGLTDVMDIKQAGGDLS